MSILVAISHLLHKILSRWGNAWKVTPDDTPATLRFPHPMATHLTIPILVIVTASYRYISAIQYTVLLSVICGITQALKEEQAFLVATLTDDDRRQE